MQLTSHLTKPSRRWQIGQLAESNRLLASLSTNDFLLLAPHLRAVSLHTGAILHNAGDQIEQVYFPQTGMISLVTVMQSGASVQSATVGRTGVVGAIAGFGSRWAFGTAIVEIAGDAVCLPASQFRTAVEQSDAVRTLAVAYNDLLLTHTSMRRLQCAAFA